MGVPNTPFQMEYISFIRMRITNKNMYGYVDKYRDQLNVNIFHNYTITFKLATHEYPHKPQFFFHPPNFKVLDYFRHSNQTLQLTDVDASLLFNNDKEQIDYYRHLIGHRENIWGMEYACKYIVSLE